MRSVVHRLCIFFTQLIKSRAKRHCMTVTPDKTMNRRFITHSCFAHDKEFPSGRLGQTTGFILTESKWLRSRIDAHHRFRVAGWATVIADDV